VSDRLTDLLVANHVNFISSGSVMFTNKPLGFASAALIRDPDGHAVRLIEN
jgi:hypothetical protein